MELTKNVSRLQYFVDYMQSKTTKKKYFFLYIAPPPHFLELQTKLCEADMIHATSIQSFGYALWLAS